MLGMRHEPHDVAGLVADACDRAGAAVHVVRVVDLAARRAVAERDETLALDTAEVVLARHELTLAVLHRDAERLAGHEPGGQRRERRLDPNVDPSAHEPELAGSGPRAPPQTPPAEGLGTRAEPHH